VQDVIDSGGPGGTESTSAAVLRAREAEARAVQLEKDLQDRIDSIKHEYEAQLRQKKEELNVLRDRSSRMKNSNSKMKQELSELREQSERLRLQLEKAKHLSAADEKHQHDAIESAFKEIKSTQLPPEDADAFAQTDRLAGWSFERMVASAETGIGTTIAQAMVKQLREQAEKSGAEWCPALERLYGEALAQNKDAIGLVESMLRAADVSRIAAKRIVEQLEKVKAAGDVMRGRLRSSAQAVVLASKFSMGVERNDMTLQYGTIRNSIELQYGTIGDFVMGLEGIVGKVPCEDPNALGIEMEKEHCQNDNSRNIFEASNYGTKTTPEVEFYFVKEPNGAKAVEAKKRLFHATLGLAGAPPDDSTWPSETRNSEKPRVPYGPEAFKRDLEERNSKLRQLNTPPLATDEFIATRLYTGPMYECYCAVLRGLKITCFAKKNLELNMGNVYVCTLHLINNAVVKLSKLTVASTLYRGLVGALPPQFQVEDEYNIIGGVEFGFMSATADKQVAIQYCQGKMPSVVLQIEQGMVNRGADIAWLSQYPEEKETLFPPLTALEVVRDPSTERVCPTTVGAVAMLPVRPSVSQRLLLARENNLRLAVTPTVDITYLSGQLSLAAIECKKLQKAEEEKAAADAKAAIEEHARRDERRRRERERAAERLREEEELRAKIAAKEAALADAAEKKKEVLRMQREEHEMERKRARERLDAERAVVEQRLAAEREMQAQRLAAAREAEEEARRREAKMHAERVKAEKELEAAARSRADAMASELRIKEHSVELERQQLELERLRAEEQEKLRRLKNREVWFSHLKEQRRHHELPLPSLFYVFTHATEKNATVDGVLVEISATDVSFRKVVQSGAKGLEFPLREVPEGRLRLTCCAKGFEEVQFDVFHISEADVEKQPCRLVMSPELSVGSLRVVLMWGDKPKDLDLHCIDSEQNHVSFRQKESQTKHIQLDLDDTDGHGPETITVQSRTNQAYSFFVHNYTHEVDFAQSAARLILYVADVPAREFALPKNGDANLRHWKVCTVHVDSNLATAIEQHGEFLRGEYVKDEPGAPASGRASEFPMDMRRPPSTRFVTMQQELAGVTSVQMVQREAGQVKQAL